MQRKSDSTQLFNDKKITGTIAVLVLLGLVLIFMVNVTSTALSGARAFIDGEGVLSKAQKQASLSLVYYLEEEEEKYYEDFKESKAVIESYKKNRKELSKDDPDVQKLQKINRGLARGRSNSEDIRSAVWVYKYLSWTPSMKRADSIWMQAQDLMIELTELGETIHQQILNDELTVEGQEAYLAELYVLDNELTRVESNFSETITHSSIYLNNVIYWTTLGVGLLLLAAGGFVMVSFLRNAKQWSDSITESEQKFRNVLENTKDVIYKLDMHRKEYVYMSPSVEGMLGYTSKEIIEKGPEFVFGLIHPDDLEKLQKELGEIRDEKPFDTYSSETEFRIQTKNNGYIWVDNKRRVVIDSNGRADYLVGNVRDISDRKRYEEQIDEALEEKKVLLQEIHHRVKNNLAVISGLLYLQKDKLEEPARSEFQKMQSRIDSVAMIHEKLYGSESLAEINLDQYIDELTDAIAHAYESDQKIICLEKNLEPIVIEISDAVSYGLAINELVNNAYKHAFARGSEGKIRIELKKEEDNNVLLVADNGAGLPENFFGGETSSLGMTLVHSLLGQANAELEITQGDWTEFKIVFTASDAKEHELVESRT